MNYSKKRLFTIKILLQSEIIVDIYNKYHIYKLYKSRNTLNKLLIISIVNYILYTLSVVLFLSTQI